MAHVTHSGFYLNLLRCYRLLVQVFDAIPIRPTQYTDPGFNFFEWRPYYAAIYGRYLPADHTPQQHP